MARPQKQGLDYFPLDTVFDTNMELIEAEYGLTGFAVVVKLWQKIYAECGYYCEWTDEVALLFAKRNNVGCNAVSEIIAAAIKRGIFDKDLYDKYNILTSSGIQKRYFEAVNRRLQIEIKEEYLLVSYTQNAENVDKNQVNVDINQVNVDINPQTKVKDKKEEEIKRDYIKLNNKDVALVKSTYESSIGMLSPVVAEKLYSWLESVDVSLIIYAIEEACKSGVKKPTYIYAILQNQFNAGCTTKEQAIEKEQTNKGKKKNSFTDYNNDDYDIEKDLMKKRMENDAI